MPARAFAEILMQDLTLPSFEMDCRDWVVVTPDEAGIPDEGAGTPLLAMLSTVVIGVDRCPPAGGVRSVGLVDGATPSAVPVDGGEVAAELIDEEMDEFGMRFVLP